MLPQEWLTGKRIIRQMTDIWIEQMERYNLRYKHAESNAIAKSILSYLQTLTLDEGTIESEYLVLRIEDIKQFVQSE